MKTLIWFSAMIVLVLGHSTKKLNIDQFANVSRFYHSIPICEHEADVRTWYDKDGKIMISFKITIGPHDSEDVLCKCMWAYLNQRCFLGDVVHKCAVNDNQLTIFLIGPPNPKYDPEQPLPKVDAPLATLGDLLKNYPDLELADHKCRTHTNVTDTGLIRMSIECKLTAKSLCSSC